MLTIEANSIVKFRSKSINVLVQLDTSLTTDDLILQRRQLIIIIIIIIIFV